MEAVIDTNVLVSGLLCADSPPGEIVDLVFANSITPVFDDRILYEYRHVLARPKFAFPKTVVEELMGVLVTIGLQVIATHTQSKLPDEKDRCIFECAQVDTRQSAKKTGTEFRNQFFFRIERASEWGSLSDA